MRNTTKRILAVCSVVVLLVLVTSITAIPAFAASNGIYLASAHPHYRHPYTGNIEDSGGESSEVLGQSMTESATYKKALVEVDPDGNTYITVRLLLQNNCSSVSFSVDGVAASAICMQEGNDTADYRMRVNSENSVLRCKMFVDPMGRDVIFYITVSDLQPGSGDFETSVEVIPTEPEPTDPEPTESRPAESKPAESQATEPQTTESREPTEQTTAPETTAPETTAPETTVKETAAPETTVKETAAPETTEKETAVPESTEVQGLQEFNDAGDKIEETKPAEGQKDSGNGSIFLWVILGIAVVGGAAFCIWYFGSFKKK